jgi:hypothetical protein
VACFLSLEAVVVFGGCFLIGFCSSCVVILVVEAFYYNFVIICNNFVIFVFLCLK